LPVSVGFADTRAFLRVCEEAEFCEDGWAFIVTKDVKTSGAYAAIGASGNADDPGVDGSGEGGSASVVVIGFDTMAVTIGSGVEVDAHENRLSGGAIGNGDTFGEFDEDVGGSSHDDAMTGGFQFGLDTPGDIEGAVFFADTLAGNAAWIMAAMTCIEDDGGCLDLGGV